MRGGVTQLETTPAEQSLPTDSPPLDAPTNAIVAFPPPQEEVVTAELVDRPAEPRQRPQSWPMIAWYGLCFALEWLFGLASLLFTLAVLAAVPIVNFVTLGYLLEASARVAKSGRLRDGFIDIGKFARIGSLVAGTWLWLLVPRLVSSLATDAWLIDPGSSRAFAWRIALVVSTVLVIAHILLAWYSGGRLRHFFWPLLAPFQLAGRFLFGGIVGPITRPLASRLWPALADDLYAMRPLEEWFPPAILAAGLRRGRLFAAARDAVWDFFVSLRLPYYFWLGLRGFAGAIAWLLVPSLMLMAGTSAGGPGTILIGYLGALGLAFVLLYLPFLQTHFALHNRLAAMFEWSAVRGLFRRAPIAWWLALAITLLFALPLYLLKIEPPPRELWWTLTFFFILFIYPARLLTGWAVGRALHHDKLRFFLFRWMSRLAAIPIVLVYVLVLFFTQYTSFLGPASILEQHAFLVPVPFLAL
jgi:hypothetical protein